MNPSGRYRDRTRSGQLIGQSKREHVTRDPLNEYDAGEVAPSFTPASGDSEPENSTSRCSAAVVVDLSVRGLLDQALEPHPADGDFTEQVMSSIRAHGLRQAPGSRAP